MKWVWTVVAFWVFLYLVGGVFRVIAMVFGILGLLFLALVGLFFSWVIVRTTRESRIRWKAAREADREARELTRKGSEPPGTQEPLDP